MVTIDLLSCAGKDVGARFDDGHFEVTQPWGHLAFEAIELSAGWYRLDVIGGDAPALLQLLDENSYELIELSARRGEPAYVRLAGCRYRAELFPPARPGRYAITSVCLRRLTGWERAVLLNGRFLQALKAGYSPSRILSLVRTALQGHRTVGIRARQGERSRLGALIASDVAQQAEPSQDYSQRLARVTEGPIFRIEGTGESNLSEQVYRRFTVNRDHPYDFVLTLAPGDRLTPDALLLFAEHLIRHPDTSVALADAWIDHYPTARVAWDPILYSDGYPVPYCVKRGFVPREGLDNRKDFSVLSLPVAFCRADVLSEVSSEAAIAGPACSLIIPTRDRADLLGACLHGLFENTAWPHEVIVVDNGSVESETMVLFERYRARGLKTIRADIPFNFSTLCNLGAAAATTPYLVFLNNDVVLHRADWLGEMMSYAVRNDVGAVGARLLYADGRLQHGGIMLGLTQVCGHLWRGYSRDDQDGEPRLRRSSLRSAVTAACLCVAKAKFDAVGGFDETRFPVTLNDVDLCLKLGARGWFSVYAARAEAYHMEGESRGEDLTPPKLARRKAELDAFLEVWSGQVAHDPWLPEAVSRATESFYYR